MFFNTQDFAEQKVSIDHIREWANEITSSYLNAGAQPTHTLEKIATAEELTPHQIQVLAAEANKAIHQAKYANVKDKYHAADFPLADAKHVIGELQAGGSEKVAAVMVEPKISTQGPDPYQMFGVKPEEMNKTASVKYQLKTAQTRAVLLSQKLGDKVLMTKMASEAAEAVFIKQARQIVLDSYGSIERMKVLGILGEFVKQSGIKEGKKSLAKLAQVLRLEGKLEPFHAKIATDFFMKKADEKAPEALISKNLPAQIVNGNHPLYITLKTLEDRNKEFSDYSHRRNIVDDELKLIRQRVRAL